MRYYIQFKTHDNITELAYKANNAENALAKFEKDMKRNTDVVFVSITEKSTLPSRPRSYHSETSSLAKKTTSKGSARALIG